MFAVEMQHISKRFGITFANEDINFQVHKGEIHALVGENGAGKSTLMNILYGIHSPDHGDIIINQKKEILENPLKAISLGIGMVHQHFMLIPPFTIAENIILGKEFVRIFNVLDLSKAEQEITKLSETYHLNINSREKIESLSVGLQQRVEILKILYRNADILIFDEPTAVLTPQESEELFSIFTLLKNQNKTIVFISHKLSEVMSISDRVTVMRQGKIIDILDTASSSESELARKMVGKEIATTTKKDILVEAKPVFVVENLSAFNERNLPAIRNVSFAIKTGEILGIAGVEGNGQSELIQVLTGLRKHSSGSVSVNGKEILSSCHNVPVAHIPEDRLKHGLVADFSISENLILGRHTESGIAGIFTLQRKQIESFSNEMILKFDIRPADAAQHARSLSGGNQQKVVIAREISKDAPVIIASQPTRGLDIGAQNFVHQTLLFEREKGKAILLISSDLTELLLLSDRIAVMYEGNIVAILPSNKTSERELGLYMTGAVRKAS